MYTNSEKVIKQRSTTLRLLQKRAPDSSVIASLCEIYHAPKLERLKEAQEGKCILCSLCVRACDALGTGAISSANRGITKEVTTPYEEPADACIGCGSCARVCPTQAIQMQENGQSRTIWGRTFQIAPCKVCGQTLGTEEEILYAAQKANSQEADFLCDTCRKKQMSDVLAHTYGVI